MASNANRLTDQEKRVIAAMYPAHSVLHIATKLGSHYSRVHRYVHTHLGSPSRFKASRRREIVEAVVTGAESVASAAIRFRMSATSVYRFLAEAGYYRRVTEQWVLIEPETSHPREAPDVARQSA
ncbi:MAG: hypothetical protein Q8N51_00970 [Gammaproteobacteria bacterium]|nr:hypothetical protein [Gammaproteobacteria bacterium]